MRNKPNDESKGGKKKSKEGLIRQYIINNYIRNEKTHRICFIEITLDNLTQYSVYTELSLRKLKEEKVDDRATDKKYIHNIHLSTET